MTAPTRDSVSARFVAHPQSVPTARRLTADALRAWSLHALVDDANLVVSELCTNATLHSGAPFFSLGLTRLGDAHVRLAVGDGGSVPSAAVVRRPGVLHARSPDELRSEATTGRGLAIVDALAVDWGVEPHDDGKWVWAELSADPGAVRSAPAGPGPAGLPAGAAPLPPGWHRVRLVRCPVALGLAQDDHLDELVRELQLLGTDVDDAELAPLIRSLVDRHAAARHMGRRTAQDAAAQGLDAVTVEMLLPEQAADDVARLHQAVLAADALCERRSLLTLASTPDVRALRTWMHDELRAQLLHGAQPTPFDDWREAHGS